MKIATYHLERGVALGKLDQLVGSRTLGSTITTHYHLRSYNILGLGLLILWSISPIGGQAILRVQSTNSKLKVTPATFNYFNTDTASQVTVTFATGPDNADGVDAWFARIASLYTATLLATDTFKDNPLDLWGNVKIPFLSSYNGSLDGSWSKLPDNSSLYYYSALAGIPISEIPLGTTNFSIESSYMETNCQNISYRAEEIDLLSGFTYDYDYTPPGISSSSNGTYRGANWTDNTSPPPPDASWTLGLDNFVSPVYSICNSSYGYSQGYMGSPSQLPPLSDEQVSTATLFFQAIDPAYNAPRGSPTASTAAFCKVQQIYVESNITCMQSSTMPARLCSVTAQRLSQKYHAPGAITPLSFPQLFDAISYYLPRAFGVVPGDGGSDPSVFYLNSTSTALMTSGSVSSEINGHAQTAIVYNVPPEILSYRLAQIINTYHLLTQTGTLITGGTPSTSGIQISSNITGIATTPFEVYSISWPWLAVFTFAILVLFICAIMAMVYSMACANPEILGTCSSIIRDSRYIRVPNGGGTLDGLEMTRLLRDIRIQMGVVGDDNGGVSHLAIAKMEDVERTAKIGLYA